MGVCEKLEKCPFYQGKLIVESNLSDFLKAQYCKGNKENCARYKVFQELGPEFVDNNLFPHMTDRAAYIIAENKNEPVQDKE